MKRFLLLCCSLLLSCNSGKTLNEPNFEAIKYFTIHSERPGTIIKEELENNDAILLSYPDYSVESYELIRFIAMIMLKTSDINVYMPQMPTNKNSTIQEGIRAFNPLLGFVEFIELYDFLKSKNIPLNSIIKTDGKKTLILAPESKYKDVIDKATKEYNEKNLLKIVLAGTDLTYEALPIIKKLPIAKQISSIPLKDSTLTKLKKDFNVLIFMGLVDNYKPVTPLELYTSENFSEAPDDFINLNKSFIQSIKIKKMNKYLPTLINKKFRTYGDFK